MKTQYTNMTMATVKIKTTLGETLTVPSLSSISFDGEIKNQTFIVSLN